MKSILTGLIICFLAVGTASAQNSLTADFDASLSSFTSGGVNYLNLSKSLEEKQITIKNSKEKPEELQFYRWLWPQVGMAYGPTTWDYSLFYNRVSGETQKSYDSNLYDFKFVYDTNKRRGDDLTTDISNIQSVNCIWTLDESVNLTGDRQKREFNKLYKDLSVIISKYFGNKNETGSFKVAQRAFTKFELGGRETDGSEISGQQVSGVTPPKLEKGTVWGKINEGAASIDEGSKVSLLSLNYDKDRKQYFISFNAKVR